MRARSTLRGEAIQGERADWAPLRELVGEEVTGDFMWMFEVAACRTLGDALGC